MQIPADSKKYDYQDRVWELPISGKESQLVSFKFCHKINLVNDTEYFF